MVGAAQPGGAGKETLFCKGSVQTCGGIVEQQRAARIERENGQEKVLTLYSIVYRKSSSSLGALWHLPCLFDLLIFTSLHY